jgi:ribosomal subunit interface protein
MIQKLEISGIHIKVEDDLHKYILKKIGKLDQYIPRNARESTHVEVKLKVVKAKQRKLATCEVIVHLPQGNITTKETTFNMFAAVDIVEQKLKNQIKKYKETHSRTRLHHRVIAKVLAHRAI